MLFLALLLALTGLTACGKDVEITPPRAPGDSTGQRADEAQQQLDRLVHAIRDGSRSDAVATAAKDSTGRLGSVFDNASDLHIGDLTMRYVDEAAPLTQEEQGHFAPGAWRATVQLTYRYDGYDRAPARMETAVVFEPEGRAIRIASFGGGGGDARTPLWLVERLSVVRTPRTLVAVAAASPGRYPALVATALRQVAQVLPDWMGPLSVEVPESQDELNAALEAQPDEYDNIAAVTTSADGSLAPDAPVRVFVNPAVFDDLKQRGAQVVMSHESTHVATGATFASMPTWLLEGFADFVALDHAGVPVGLAAGQILPRIRRKGLPDRLPTSGDLDPTANGLGATYEEAWLACRFLGQAYGERALVRFYRTVNDGSSTQDAFHTVLHTTQKEFVARWRDDLARLAGVAG